MLDAKRTFSAEQHLNQNSNDETIFANNFDNLKRLIRGY